MTNHFAAVGVIGVTLDRRTGAQLARGRSIEQQRLDLALEAEWRRRVRENVKRRATRRLRAWASTTASPG
jgi:hypothetical protein